jgi:hypothetical protein
MHAGNGRQPGCSPYPEFIRKHTPVIGMSGTPWKLADHKFDGVLPKPFQIDCLIEAARALTSPVC